VSEASVSADATQVVWTDSRNDASYALNLATGERTTLPKFPIPDHREVRVLDESRIAVGGQIWSVASNGPVLTLTTNPYIEHVASTEDGRYVCDDCRRRRPALGNVNRETGWQAAPE